MRLVFTMHALPNFESHNANSKYETLAELLRIALNTFHTKLNHKMLKNRHL